MCIQNNAYNFQVYKRAGHFVSYSLKAMYVGFFWYLLESFSIALPPESKHRFPFLQEALIQGLTFPHRLYQVRRLSLLSVLLLLLFRFRLLCVGVKVQNMDQSACTTACVVILYQRQVTTMFWNMSVFSGFIKKSQRLDKNVC